MKRSWMLIIVAVALSTAFFAGCKDSSSDPDVDSFEILTAYMDANGMSFNELFSGWTILPDSLIQVRQQRYVMDIRTGDKDNNGIIDYHDGHVPGSVLSSFSTIVEDAALADNPIVVVCYTGQEAGHAVMALRLSGYSDAQILKWGMSGWNSDFDLWTGECNTLDHENWIDPPGDIAQSQTYELPEFDTDSEDGAEILAERVAYMLGQGFKGITNEVVLGSPDSYFINNYWAAEDVATYGNISGAYRIKPMVLENLHPDAVVVTYCWSGQESSMVTAYLTVLGYDAKSLKYGVNGIIYDDLTKGFWPGSWDYDYEVTP